MKKGLLISLFTVMLLAMTACGGKGEKLPTVPSENQPSQEAEAPAEAENEQEPMAGEASSDENTETENVQGPSEEKAQEESKESESESEEAKAEPAYLDVVLERNWDGSYADIELLNANYQTLSLRSTEYPALLATLEAVTKAHQEEIQSYIDQMKTDAASLYEHHGAEEFMGPYEYISDTFVKRADDKVLSFMESVHTYEGGAHGTNYYNAFNFDVQTGAEITLEDVITDINALPMILEDELLEKYSDEGYFYEAPSEMLMPYITPGAEYQPEFTWTIGYDGVTFYFSNYEITAYAAGTQAVTVLYSEYPQIFRENYSTGIGENYVIKLDDNWAGLDTDLNGDGVKDIIRVTTNYNPDYEFNESFNVTVNDNTFTQETYCYGLDKYLVRAGDDYYLYIQRTVENDYQSVCVFRITENSVEFMGEFEGGMGNFTNSADFEVRRRMDMLSTYTGIARCSVGAEGLPAEKEGVYKVDHELSIVSTVDIEAELTDGEGNLTGEGFAFPAGTEFTFMETDGETYVDMKADDGQFCRFYTTNEWPAMVNGMDATESFEMLWYAG